MASAIWRYFVMFWHEHPVVVVMDASFGLAVGILIGVLTRRNRLEKK